jgi:hypothetical protein
MPPAPVEIPLVEAPSQVAMMSPQKKELRSKLKKLRDHHQELRERRRKILRGRAQDALRRDRAQLDLRRGVTAGRERTARRGCGVYPIPVLPDEHN